MDYRVCIKLNQQQSISIECHLCTLKCHVLVAGIERPAFVWSQNKTYSLVTGHDGRPGGVARALVHVEGEDF